MAKRVKYPRTFHCPWTLEKTKDDKMHSVADMLRIFEGREVVVTEKLDGENTTLYPDTHCHARSMDSATHPARDWVRRLAGEIGHEIPPGWRICGENMFQQHSIEYDKLRSYFYTFHIFDEHNIALSWDEVVEYSALLGLETVPVLYRGVYDEAAIRACWDGTSKVGTVSEGYVIRLAGRFPHKAFAKSTAKMVRAGHVQTDEHVMFGPVVSNRLADLVLDQGAQE